MELKGKNPGLRTSNFAGGFEVARWMELLQEGLWNTVVDWGVPLVMQKVQGCAGAKKLLPCKDENLRERKDWIGKSCSESGLLRWVLGQSKKGIQLV